MRLDEQQILDGMLHSKQGVRNLTLDYFTDCFTDNCEAMPRVMEAVERYGWDEAFAGYGFLPRLPQTDETLVWALEALANVSEEPDEAEANRALHLSRLVTGADVELLLRRENDVLEAPGLMAEARRTVEHRLGLVGQDPEALWQQLERFSEGEADDGYAEEIDFSVARNLVDALSREPEQFAGRVLAAIDKHDDPSDEGFRSEMEALAVELAGRMRLESAVPRIIRKLHVDADWLNEQCVEALARIGTDAAVEALAADFPGAEWPFRLYGAGAFERIPRPLSAERALELAEREDDDSIRGFLLQAALRQFDDRAVGPTRRFLLSRELTPDRTELRTDLLDAAELMGVAFPEQERWREESQHDMEFRRRWYAQHRLQSSRRPAPEPVLPEPVMPVQRSEKVGRNEPCPCGSGRKYKRCCGGM